MRMIPRLGEGTHENGFYTDATVLVPEDKLLRDAIEGSTRYLRELEEEVAESTSKSPSDQLELSQKIEAQKVHIRQYQERLTRVHDAEKTRIPDADTQ